MPVRQKRKAASRSDKLGSSTKPSTSGARAEANTRSTITGSTSNPGLRIGRTCRSPSWRVIDGRIAEMHSALTDSAGPYQANAVLRTFRALYNFARRQTPDELPFECPTLAVTFHPEKRRDTAMGMDDLPGWWEQLRAIENPIRAEFHLMNLLTGSRPGALKVARWKDLDVKRRVLHMPRPKGGEGKAFDIPLSRAMLRSLWRVRKSGRMMYARQAREWIFPSSGGFGHLAEHKEDRKTLSHWGGDLRQTYRTVAQAIGISELDIHLLMNHAVAGVSAGYITRAKLVPTSLRDAQEKLSRAMIERMIPDPKDRRGLSRRTDSEA